MADEVLYDDGDVVVTEHVLWTRGVSYPLARLHGARIEEEQREPSSLWVGLLPVACHALFFCYATAAAGRWGFFGCLAALAGACVGLAQWDWLRARTPTYYLVLRTPAGAVDALASPARGELEPIAAALEAALAAARPLAAPRREAVALVAAA